MSCRFLQWGPLFVGIGLTLCNPRLIASLRKCFSYITLEAVKSPILSVRKCDPLLKQFRFREWIVKGRHKFCRRSFLCLFITWCTSNLCCSDWSSDSSIFECIQDFFFALYHSKISAFYNVLTTNLIVFSALPNMFVTSKWRFRAYLSRISQLTLRTCRWKLIWLSSTSVSANNVHTKFESSSEGLVNHHVTEPQGRLPLWTQKFIMGGHRNRG